MPTEQETEDLEAQIQNGAINKETLDQAQNPAEMASDEKKEPMQLPDFYNLNDLKAIYDFQLAFYKAITGIAYAKPFDQKDAEGNEQLLRTKIKELREDINIVLTSTSGNDQKTGKRDLHIFTDIEGFLQPEDFINKTLPDQILRLAQPCQSFMDHACYMVCFTREEMLSLLKENDRKAIEARAKYVQDMIKQLREANEDKVIELTSGKLASEVDWFAFTEQEEYHVCNLIYSEYIYFATYESIRLNLIKNKLFEEYDSQRIHTLDSIELEISIDSIEEISIPTIEISMTQHIIKENVNEWSFDVPVVTVQEEAEQVFFNCKKGKEEHVEPFLCPICYEYQAPMNKVEINCDNKCTSCKSCIKSSIVAQFDQARIGSFKCLCGGDFLDEDFVERYLGEDEFKRLRRFRLSRMIDNNPKMIWCPNMECEREIEKKGRKNKVECTYCKTEACFKCHKSWHKGSCDSEQQGAYSFFLARKDVRKCPKCSVRIEKNSGCAHMSCFRCNYEFCWACMGDMEGHNKWYKPCPRLPYGMCGNILITFLFILLLPVGLTLGPLFVCLYYSVILTLNCSLNCYGSWSSKCLMILLLIFIWILFSLPLAILIGAVGAALALALAMVPLWLAAILFLIRLAFNSCMIR